MSSLLLLLVAQLCRPFETSWTAARQAFLSFSVSQSLLRLMSIELMMPSNHPIFHCPLLLIPSIFPTIRVFSNSQLFTSNGRSTGVSVSPSVLPMNIQGWFPLELTGLISLQAKELSRVFSNTMVQKHQFKNKNNNNKKTKSINSSALSLLYSPTLTSIHETTRKTTVLTIWTLSAK